jgi:hypothetical protein
VAPEDRDENGVRVLVYSRTAGPRHANLGTALTAGTNRQDSAGVVCTPPGPANNPCPALNANNVAQQALRTWLNAEGIQVDITEDVTRLSGLNQYRAVIFMSRRAIRCGSMAPPSSRPRPSTRRRTRTSTPPRPRCASTCGPAADSSASTTRFGTEYNWPYYEGLLGNANYYDHGANQLGTAQVVAADPSTAGLRPASRRSTSGTT